MTYYEEFGIPTSATPAEIHQAHRRLIKILHPDLQGGAANRKLAEIQTRRINRIAQILLNPVERKEYETGLLIPAQPPSPTSERKTNRDTFANLVVIGLFVLAGLWILQTGPHVPGEATAASEADPTGRKPHNSQEDKNERPASQNRASQGPKTRPDSNPTPSEQPAPHALESSNPTPIGVLPNEPATKHDSTTEIASASAAEHKTQPVASSTDSPFVGTWIYVPAPAADEDRKMYRPEYIEMRVRYVEGMIEGQYRARYHVPDRPLSPNVGFHFAGEPPAGQSRSDAAFRWHGTNGLGGQVQLKIVTANSIQVDWHVTDLTESADLVSGTAILTRLQ